MKPLQCVRSTVLLTMLLGVCYAQDELQYRIYDVRDLVRTESGFRPSTVLDASFVPSREELQDDPSPAVQIVDLTTMVQEGASREYWQKDGVEIRPEDAGFLSVTCSDAMHKTVSQTLSKLRQLLFEPVLVEVHELRGLATGQLDSVLSAEQADALLAQAGEHRVHFGRANVRKPLLLESQRIQSRITGMRVRLADSAEASSPMLETDTLGASWTVQAIRTVGESMLVTVSGSDRALEAEPISRKMPSSDGNSTVSLELHATRILNCHASAHLQPGQAMLVGSNTDAGALLCVRVYAMDQAPSAVLGEVTVYPIASLVRGASPAIDVRLPFSDAMLFPPVDAEPMPTIVDDGRLMECIACQVAPDSWDGAPNTMHYVDGQLLVHADQAVQADVKKMLREFHALDARQFSLEVRFGEVNAKAVRAIRTTEPDQLAATLPQYCLATVSASRSTQVSATRHVPFIRSFDASVATNSTAIVPVVDSYAEGFLLRGKVAPMDPDSVMLDLHLTTMSCGSEHSTFELGHPRIGAIDKVDVRESKVRGNTAVALGKWTLVHLAPIEGGSSHIAVVARVQPL